VYVINIILITMELAKLAHSNLFAKGVLIIYVHNASLNTTYNKEFVKNVVNKIV